MVIQAPHSILQETEEPAQVLHSENILSTKFVECLALKSRLSPSFYNSVLLK